MLYNILKGGFMQVEIYESMLPMIIVILCGVFVIFQWLSIWNKINQISTIGKVIYILSFLPVIILVVYDIGYGYWTNQIVNVASGPILQYNLGMNHEILFLFMSSIMLNYVKTEIVEQSTEIEDQVEGEE